MPQRAFPAGSALIWLVIFLYAAQAAVRRAPERLRMKGNRSHAIHAYRRKSGGSAAEVGPARHV